MAGLRAGFAIARKETIDELRRVRTPFGLNSFTEAATIGALDNRGWIEDRVRQMRLQREFLSKRMDGLGFAVLPSVCNFVTAKCQVNGPGLVFALKERGVAVRDCNSFPMLEDHIRVTVGPRPMMERFLEAAAQSIEEVSP
jgi:histidinol-phosphate aminotransferase